MTTDEPVAPSLAGADLVTDLDEDARKRLQSYIEEEAGAFNRLDGWVGTAIATFAVLVSFFHLYAAYEIDRKSVV